MKTTIKFNKNTDVAEIENVIAAAIKKYSVRHDRYSTEKNSQFEISKRQISNTHFEYDVTGKRVNGTVVELQLGFDELIDDDVYELMIITHEIAEFEGYIDRTEFSEIVTFKENKALVEDDKTFIETKKNIHHAEQLFADTTTESWDLANSIIDSEKDKIKELKKSYQK